MDDIIIEADGDLPYAPGNSRGRPPKYETPDLLANKIDQYFNTCKPEVMTYTNEDGEVVPVMDKGKPVMIEHKPTVAGLTLFLGYASPQSLYDIKAKNDGFAYIVIAALTHIQEAHEQNLFSPSCSGSQFWLKNYAGLKDKTDIEVSTPAPIDTSNLTPEERDAIIRAGNVLNKPKDG
jgi:hypothetical protein